MRFACLFCCTQLSVQFHVASLLSARSLVEGMEPSFCAQLQTAGIHADIIAFLGNDKNRVYSITRFANFIDQRSEIQSHILNHVAACKDDRGQRATLCEDIAEQHRLENKAKGLSQNDFEEPLSIGALDGYLDKFEAFYHYRHFLTEILAEPLVGRLKREIDRKTFTVLPAVSATTRRVQSRRWGSTSSSPRTWLSSSVRPVVDHHLAVYLCKVLWEGGWAVVGNFEHTDGSQFASLQACKTYVREFAEAATPLGRPHPPLVEVLAADEDTRALHAASLQKGLSLDLAIKTNEGKKAALWLWACGDEAAK